MTEDDLKTLNISIAGRQFPVKVTDQEVDDLRALEQTLNAKISEYQATYPGRDKLDYVIMTMLAHTFELKKSSHDEVNTQAIAHKIKQLHHMFDESE